MGGLSHLLGGGCFGAFGIGTGLLGLFEGGGVGCGEGFGTLLGQTVGGFLNLRGSACFFFIHSDPNFTSLSLRSFAAKRSRVPCGASPARSSLCIIFLRFVH